MAHNRRPDSSLLIRDLGDGLILRRGSREDAEALGTFNAIIHSDEGPDKPNVYVGAWVRDLVEKDHPTLDAGDFTLVENISSGEIISSLSLIPQTWQYDGIPFQVGRPELVGTLPDYRKRGLIRAQFEVIHQWSAERGYQLQAITGIPYYYRLFGYEMALNLGGGRAGYWSTLPKLKEEEQEPYQVRPARAGDLPLIEDLYRQSAQRNLVYCVWDSALWRHELMDKRAKNINRRELRIIETPTGDRVGFLAHPAMTWGAAMPATAYELKPGIPWNAVTPSVARYLYATGKAYAQAEGKQDKFDSFSFELGVEHPAYQVMHDALPRVRTPYAWYLRVADLPDFLRRITPVLEQRLAQSAYAGYQGELKLTFYRGGVHMVFEAGKLAEVNAYEPTPHSHSGDAAFPQLSFLQLLFGYRSLEELDHAFADCYWQHDTAYGLLMALFPKRVSNIWPVS